MADKVGYAILPDNRAAPAELRYFILLTESRSNNNTITAPPVLEDKPGNFTEGNEFILFGILIAAFVLSYFLLVSAKGEFPIGDDFIYAQAVQQSLRVGHLTLSWSAQPCYLHIILGALVCKPFGFSYFSLRIINMLWTVAGCAGLWLSLRLLGLSRIASVLISAVYLFCPLIYWMSFTYITDSASLALTNWYLYFILVGLRQNSFKHILAGTGSLVTSLATRIFTLAFLPASGAACLLSCRGTKQRMQSLLVCVLLPLLVGLGLPYLFHITEPGSSSKSASYMGKDISSFCLLLFHHPVKALLTITVAAGQLAVYLGALCAPVLIPFACRLVTGKLRLPLVSWLSTVSIMAASLIVLVGVEGKLMPFNTNILTPPFTCIPAVVGWPLHSVQGIVVAATAISALLGFVYLAINIASLSRILASLPAKILATNKSATSEIQTDDKISGFVLAFLISAYAFVTLLVVAHDLDRYYSMTLAPSLIALGLAWKKARMDSKWTLSVMAAFVFLLVAYSIATLHDCMCSYRAKASALSALLDKGVSPLSIDGGWEFNGMSNPHVADYPHADNRSSHIALPYRGTWPTNHERWWGVTADDYVISNNKEFEGYEVVARFGYPSWALGCKREMLALKRISPVTASPETQPANKTPR